ncbi:MAG: hypothetical protein COW00_09355 [Bdellovibrio sp. CG12_big_fil_rev_8_21_14_0_65_39_13]|nr:MAG: hypothetical protein COW78_09430 [Bdellovibrio sp. CG22_combo_CG10-13_8_21_14_all_39_27]PIQ59828.1 MAG: hypothetical protein COW00_09355 [Bdellovibrio sp. CG12_big_fil_rev_8_21_14_0_65_39_13]PIR36144.1 MAG: hypothetical protein COV37_04035 [Bdellovibrio sp. CG11_big_fil_rev_8_21_14_0_20_39_38]PJB52908.1 MAG: hypothetical protein CO099_10075 [Bdellovibrio sp. CG_4_9_14_3_um_filter_39_7]
MKLRASKLWFSLLLLVSFSALASGPGKLADILISESGVMELLAKRGIEGIPAQKVSSYVKNSLISLSFADRVPTKRELIEIIGGLGGSESDMAMRKQLQVLLEKPADKMSKEDVVTSINHLIYLANRYGTRGSTVLACAECVSDALKKNGFKFTLEVLEDKASKQILNDVLPRKPKDLQNYISARMRSLDLGDYSRVSKDVVAPEEERALGLFVALADKNSPASKIQRDFIDSILEVSKDSSGKVKLLSEDNPHKLWKLFDKDMDPELMKEWTDLLREVSEEGKDQASKKDAFFSVLQKRAGDDPVKLEQVNMLKSKGCYFR